MSDPRYRCSFDGVAETYERSRPPYADAAVAWIAERLRLEPGRRVLDLAAGTGKLTRLLVPFGVELVAVEPGDQMRGVLERTLPGIEALFGTAENIPLPDASVDAITIGEAMHWFEPGPAQEEMHRVLRPGGGFAGLFNSWESGDPLLASLYELTEPLRKDRGPGTDWPDQQDRTRFTELEEREFVQTRFMTADTLAGWVASTSPVAGADRETQARVDAEVRALVGGDGAEVAIGTDVRLAFRV